MAWSQLPPMHRQRARKSIFIEICQRVLFGTSFSEGCVMVVIEWFLGESKLTRNVMCETVDEKYKTIGLVDGHSENRMLTIFHQDIVIIIWVQCIFIIWNCDAGVGYTTSPFTVCTSKLSAAAPFCLPLEWTVRSCRTGAVWRECFSLHNF